MELCTGLLGAQSGRLPFATKKSWRRLWPSWVSEDGQQSGRERRSRRTGLAASARTWWCQAAKLYTLRKNKKQIYLYFSQNTCSVQHRIILWAWAPEPDSQVWILAPSGASVLCDLREASFSFCARALLSQTGITPLSVVVKFKWSKAFKVSRSTSNRLSAQ